jgi:TIR domain
MNGQVAASSGVFISYLRADSDYPAGWLFDRLAEHFGRDRVFKDVDSLQPGDDFAEVITAAVSSCAALVAVIGERWLTITDEHGRRRLDNPEDFVRLEIEAAADPRRPRHPGPGERGRHAPVRRSASKLAAVGTASGGRAQPVPLRYQRADPRPKVHGQRASCPYAASPPAIPARSGPGRAPGAAIAAHVTVDRGRRDRSGRVSWR